MKISKQLTKGKEIYLNVTITLVYISYRYIALAAIKAVGLKLTNNLKNSRLSGA